MPISFPTEEYLSKLRAYQWEYLQAEPRFRVLLWHRGSHKTTELLNNQLAECFRVKGLYWFISPYLNQGVSTVWTDPNTSIFRWIPDDVKKGLRINNSEHSITFPNGSVWQIKGADHADGLRGPKPIGIAVDEYGEIAKRWGSEIREAILEPTIHSSGGWIDYAGTPKGNNDFTHIYELGQDKTNKDWWSSKKTVDDTGLYTKEQMDDIKRNSVHLDFILQEYYCAINDGASTVFKGWEKCVRGTTEDPIPGHTYVFGIDLARTFDNTAIVGFDTSTNHLVFFKLLNNESWESQKINIHSILTKYNNAQAVVDATGIGDSFVEQLSLTGANIYPFKIAGNAIKVNLIERMAMYIGNQYISYPNIEELLKEIKNYERSVNKNNTVTYDAPSSMHDDCVIAVALVCQLLNMTPQPYVERTRYAEVVDEMQQNINPKTGYFK